VLAGTPSSTCGLDPHRWIEPRRVTRARLASKDQPVDRLQEAARFGLSPRCWSRSMAVEGGDPRGSTWATSSAT
jgi:hypothetical protein